MDTPMPEKRKSRFSLFRNRRSVLAPEPVEAIVVINPEGPPSVTDSDYSSLADVERQRALFALEGRITESSAPSSLSISPRSATQSPSGLRSDSLRSSTSTFDDMFMGSSGSRLSSSPLGQVPENTIVELETDEDGLPTYASAAYTSKPTTYQFVRCSPFAMVLADVAAGSQLDGHGMYHISIGVNVWMPSCTVTSIKRGSTEDGQLVAQLEMGIMAGPATVTIGNLCRPINEVLFRKTTSSSTRLYYLPDGNVIKWKLGSQIWQAHYGSHLLATFVPTLPRKLTLQPVSHRFSDHIIIALVILMREHLTPQANTVGEAAQMFNYAHQLHINHDMN